VLQKYTDPIKGYLIGDRRKLHNEKIHQLYSSPKVNDIILIVEMSNAYKPSVGKPDRKRPFGRPRHRWKDNIKNDHE